MLLQFSVENYQSIKNKIILELEPDAEKEHQENIICKYNTRGLNCLAIYGSNASGKTNLFKAMTAALIFIRNSNNFQINTLIPVSPFRFDDTSFNKPTKFEFVFIAKNGKKYIYGFSATKLFIVEEYLYVYNSKKPSLIFERNNSAYKFQRSQRNELELIVKRTPQNKLFLATATSWNIEVTKPAFEWLAIGIDTYSNFNDTQLNALELYRTEQNNEYTSFTQQLLQQADINISRINIETKEITSDEAKTNPFNLFFNLGMPQKQYEYRITTAHSIKESSGKTKEFQLMLSEESLGTQQLFSFGPILKQALNQGKTIIIDEIERSLHPFLVKYIIDIFRNERLNNNGSQIIVTTHCTSILSLDNFRRDQIYFTEKNQRDGVTYLYPLSNFAVRKSDNIEKGYLRGKYGAIPFPCAEDLTI